MVKIENGILVSVDNEDIIDGKFIIPEEVTSIGQRAFFRCSSLAKIEIPKNVTRIGQDAFRNCSNLTKIEIPESVTRIGSGAFWGCDSLTKIEIPESVTILGSRVFRGCRNLVSIKMPESLTSIEMDTFMKCSSLTSIKIPKNVNYIENGAFYRCSNLTKIEIPESVTRIGACAFYRCSNLTKIEIPESVTRIGWSAFEGCDSLTKIEIPESVTRIESEVFSECSSLTEIKLPKNVDESILLQLYKQYGWLIDKKLMFGDDLDRFKAIKRQAYFSLSRDYDKQFMDEIYHKIIFSLGIDELENIVRIPNSISKDKIQRYMDEKEESFKKIYNTQYKIEGDFEATLELLRIINRLKVNGNDNEKNTFKLKMLREINKLIEEGKEKSISNLIEEGIKNAGFEVQGIHEQLKEIERKLKQKTIQKKYKKYKK